MRDDWNINMSIHSQCSTIHIDTSNANPYRIYHTKDDSRTNGDDDASSLLSRSERSRGRNKDGKYERFIEVDSYIITWLESLKYLFSLALLIVSIAVITVSFLSNKTVGTKLGVPGWAAYLLFWVLIYWLAIMEGGQGCLSSLQNVNKILYKDTHLLSFRNIHLVRNVDKMIRFTVGRQCLVVLTVFLANVMVYAAKDTDVIFLGSHYESIFLKYGLGIFLIITIVGQLTAQVNASDCKIDFINSYIMIFTTYVALVVDFCGVLHAVHLVRMLFLKITGINDNEVEKNRTVGQRIFFWARVLMSCAIIGFMCVVFVDGILSEQITLWKGAPWFVTLLVSVFLMAIVGLLEGIQVAFTTAITKSEDELRQYKVASENCRLVFQNQNYQAFLIGRQICVTCCMLLMINMTIFDIKAEDGDKMIGVLDGLQDILSCGTVGAVVFTIFASLVWRIIALSCPLAFLSNPLISKIIHLCVLVEKSGICSASWVLAYCHKSFAGFQPDEIYLGTEDSRIQSARKKREHHIDRFITVVKFTFSLALLVFSVMLVMGALFTNQTVAHEMGVPAWAAFLIFWFLIVWLAMMEGGQGCLVGLQPVDKDSYKSSHPISLKSTSIAHHGDNMERFIVGRQFLVVLVVFTANMMCGVVSDASVLGLPDLVNNIFLTTGLGLILTTIVLGQLAAQVNATDCMLDFTNTYFMVFTTYCALAIEFSGLLHSVYFIQIIFSKLAGKPVESKEPQRTLGKQIFFWLRVVISCLILGFAFTVTISALFKKQTAMWAGVPEEASVVILFVLMSVVGMMEGVQIALFAVINMPKKDMLNRSVACKNCELAFTGQNLAAFLIGRQIFVTCCMFIVARITSLTVEVGMGENVFGISDNLQEFLNTGLLGAVITTIVASLAWRVIASSFPLVFLSNPLINLMIRLCLLLEKTSVCSAAWFLARYQKSMFGYQLDGVYLGGDEKEDSDPASKRDKHIDATANTIKCVCSTGLLVFSLVVVTVAMLDERTRLSTDAHPAVAIIVFWLALLWLAMMEGGQVCLVGLRATDELEYVESHPVTLKSMLIANKGNNMERIIVGRQFLVVLIIFVINMSGSVVEDLVGKSVLDIPTDIVRTCSIIALMLSTIVIGQLITQVNGVTYMLDFMNNHFMLLTTYLSLVVESTGLMHSVYLIKIIFAKLTRKTVQSDEPPLNRAQSVFFWIRVLLSCTVLGFSLVATVTALVKEKTTMWEIVPLTFCVPLFFVLIIFVGVLEGTQTALSSLRRAPEEWTSLRNRWARELCRLAFREENFTAFLVGRQMFVTCAVFVLARATTLNTPVDGGDLPADLSQRVFLNTGIGGVVVVSVTASLVWRSIALSFPENFVSNPLVYYAVHLCLFVEKFGICSASWLLSVVQKEMIGYQPDEQYISRYHGTDIETGASRQ